MVGTDFILTNRIRQCIEHASAAKCSIDRYAKPDRGTVATYKLLLQDCYENPTSGFLAKKEYYNSSSINFPSYFVRNRQMLEYDEEIIKMRERIRERINILYPRTKYIRKYIIDDNRLNLYFVKPSEGYSVFDKFKIALKMFLKRKIK